MKFRLMMTISSVSEAVLEAADLADARRRAALIQREVAKEQSPDSSVEVRIAGELPADGDDTRSA